MVIELTLTNVITLLALVIMGLWALAKLLGVQAERRLDERFAALNKTMADIAAGQDRNGAAVLELERDFRRHQAELAIHYVRREDYIRNIGVIETRIDNFALRMERSLEQLIGTARKGTSDAA